MDVFACAVVEEFGVGQEGVDLWWVVSSCLWSGRDEGGV